VVWYGDDPNHAPVPPMSARMEEHVPRRASAERFDDAVEGGGRAVRILIADGHEVIRRGLRQLIERHDGWEVCAESATGAEAVAHATRLQPDIAILDVGTPTSAGIDAVREIHQAAPDTELLIFSMHEGEEMLRGLIHAGVHGYVAKSDPTSELETAIAALAVHRRHFTASISGTVRSAFLKAVADAPDGTASHPLSAREREITQLLAEGHNNREVGSCLGISPKTVETHRAAIMRKLGLGSIAELVHYAIRNKLISP
jgi:DNA-binding NarL/FixJ family response regulator